RADAALERLLRVEEDGHRPVIHELDLHHGLEYAFAHLEAARAQDIDEGTIKRFGLVRRRRGDVAGPAPASCVSMERELGHDHDGAIRLFDRTVHHAGVVGEDPELCHLVREPRYVGLLVIASDTQQHEQPGPDRGDFHPVDGDRGARDPLNNRAHPMPRYAPAPTPGTMPLASYTAL